MISAMTASANAREDKMRYTRFDLMLFFVLGIATGLILQYFHHELASFIYECCKAVGGK